MLYFNQARVNDALKQWQKAAELKPGDPTAWYNLVFAYLLLDPADKEAAAEAWSRVTQLAPDSELAATVSMYLEGLSGRADEDVDADR